MKNIITIEEAMDDLMKPYMESAEYKNRQDEVNQAIASFRDSLTSEHQKNDFNKIINSLSDIHAEYNVEACEVAFKEGINFYKNMTEKN